MYTLQELKNNQADEELEKAASSGYGSGPPSLGLSVNPLP